MTIDQASAIALAHHQAGRLAEAEGIYRQILAVQPFHANSLHLLGVIAIACQHYPQALELIQRAISVEPHQGIFHSNLGEAYRRMGRLEEAVRSLQHSLALQPNVGATHLNLGSALHELGRFDEAIANDRIALALEPDNVEALNNLGNALTEKKQWDEALACFERALTLHPGYVKPWVNRANTYLLMERLEDSIASSRQAVALEPTLPEAHANLGAALLHKGDFESALTSYRQAVTLRPGFAMAHWNYGLLLLLLGQYEEGWRQHEWRWQAFSLPRPEIAVPEWDGRPLPGGAILLHAEQGYGDTIHLLRFVPLVLAKSQAAKVYLMCMSPLARLLNAVGGWNAEIIASDRWGDVELPRIDAHLPLLSLPLALGIFDPASPLLPRGPYLHAAPAEREKWRTRLGDPKELRVGLAWAGSRRHKSDHLRSIPWEAILTLLAVPGVRFYSLQLEPKAPLPPPLAEAGLRDVSAEIGDFADSAAFVSELDLVISVDTAVAHLAGALGKPVWTLIAFVPDWRWCVERADTPWYPSMRLFRQPAAGAWPAVIQRVAEALAHHPR